MVAESEWGMADLGPSSVEREEWEHQNTWGKKNAETKGGRGKHAGGRAAAKRVEVG